LKKLTAIFLVIVFLFNLGGYRLWFYFEQNNSDESIEASIDKAEYDEDDLLTIKVPLSLPYQNDTKDFERIEGEINFNGKIYKYVKRKIEKGEFVLLCLPDKNKMKIEEAKEDFFKYSNDLGQTNSNKQEKSKAISIKKTSGEYDEYLFSISINSLNNTFQSFPLYNKENFPCSPHISPEQPPDRISA
jgi:regulatory protein YycI of two-component signal transduction system YycFG